jgi:FkbM family methyltransferase
MFLLLLRIKKLLLIFLSLNKRINYSLVCFFTAPSYEHLKIIKKFTEINTFIDVGANRGQFSLLVNSLFPKKNILAFEPIKSEYLIYKKIFKNIENVKCFNVGLGNKTEMKKLYLTKSKDSSSFFKPSKIQNSLFRNINIVSTEIAKIERLSSFLPSLKKPIFLKIDVQGYELEVLKGADLNQIQYIYLEGSYIRLYKNQPLNKHIVKYLSIRNFELIDEYNLIKKNNKKIQADFLFKNNKNII